MLAERMSGDVESALHNLTSAIGDASSVLSNLKPTRTALPAEHQEKRIVLTRSLLLYRFAHIGYTGGSHVTINANQCRATTAETTPSPTLVGFTQ